MGKIITGAIVGIIVILAAILGVFFFNLDTVIIAGVEKYGSEVTQADVTLSEVDIDLTSGEGALRGLKVGNPDGFEEPNAFELGEISMAVNISESNEKLIHIKEIMVNGPQVTYELNSETNNLDVLKSNIDAFLKEKGLAGAASEEKTAGADDGPKLIIDKLVIKGGMVSVKAPITLNNKIEGELPMIEMMDIGKDSGGATPEDLAAQIIDKVTAGAMSVVADLGVGKTLESLSNNAGEAVKAVGEGVSGATEGAGEAVDGMSKGAGDAVEGATGAIKGLLK